MVVHIPEFIPEIKPEWKCPALTFEGLTARYGVLLVDALRRIKRVNWGICLEVEEHLRGDEEEKDGTMEIFHKAMNLSPVGDGFITGYWKSQGLYLIFSTGNFELGQQVRLQWVKHILKHLEGPVADEVNRYR